MSLVFFCCVVYLYLSLFSLSFLHTVCASVLPEVIIHLAWMPPQSDLAKQGLEDKHTSKLLYMIGEITHAHTNERERERENDPDPRNSDVCLLAVCYFLPLSSCGHCQ